MSILSDRLATCAKSQTVHLEKLDIDVEIRKMTVADAKKLEAVRKKHGDEPVVMLAYILSSFYSIDGVPICTADDVETIGGLHADIVDEMNTRFAEVNAQNLEDLKKKPMI